MGQTDLIYFFVRRKENLNKKMALVDEKQRKGRKINCFGKRSGETLRTIVHCLTL